MTKEEKIERLIAAGAKRWTKYDMDRLYISAYRIGLKLQYYKTGSVSDAFFCGERISNNCGRRYAATKSWIDCTDMSIHTDSESAVYREALERFVAETLHDGGEND